MFDINRRDKFDHMVSMSNNDFTMNNMAKDLAAKMIFLKNMLIGLIWGNIEYHFDKNK